MAKQLLYDDKAREKILAGIEKLAKAVKVTLGPGGRNVVLDKKFGSPLATKDGVTVSKDIELEDPFENMGAKLANEAADKTNDLAGDGTTTSIVLVEAIYKEGLKYMNRGYNVNRLKKGIELASEAVTNELTRISKPVDSSKEYYNVALISSHYDEEIAKLAQEAITKVGKDGVITVEESKGNETIFEYVEGMRFDKGYISPFFINKADTLTTEYDDCYILLTDKKIGNPRDLIPVLEQIAQAGKSLLIVAEEVEGEALALLVVNKLRGLLNVVASKAPAFGDRRKAILQDIAILTGGQLLSDDTGLTFENLKLKDLGHAKKVVVDKENTTIIGGKGSKNAIEARVKELQTLMQKTTSEYDREKYQERFAKLTGGVCIIKVGGTTEAEAKEKKFRVEDSIHAVRAAAKEGVIPGGGVAFLRAIPALDVLIKKAKSDDEAAGIRIVKEAIELPLYNIAKNAGFDSAVVVDEVKSLEGTKGFDATTGKYVDMLSAGIIDPTKVAKVALNGATSIASMLLTAKAAITEIKEEKKENVVAQAVH
ncbi:MAG: chaperonin GroEL [Planctomycetes bacterium]|nr:chaperonin GroEL [Planctomycetota bacterium]